MKKVIRLTESDLTRLVQRVIKEQIGSPDLATPDEIKKMALEIKSGAGIIGNPNVRTLENAVNYLRLKAPSTIRGVYKELGIQSLSQYIDDKLANAIGMNQIDTKKTDRILSVAKVLDQFIKSNKPLQEQTSQQLAAQQGLDAARAGVRDARDARRDARQDLRQTNRATNQAQQNEINAIYDVLKIRRQLGNLPDTIKKAISQYQNTEAFKPYLPAISNVLAPLDALAQAIARAQAPQQPQ
jgi:vacuolar-type H+-ATPase subunit I/STV1